MKRTSLLHSNHLESMKRIPQKEKEQEEEEEEEKDEEEEEEEESP